MQDNAAAAGGFRDPAGKASLRGRPAGAISRCSTGDCCELANPGKRRRRCRELSLRHGGKTVLDIGTEHFEHFKISFAALVSLAARSRRRGAGRECHCSIGDVVL